MVTDTTKYCNNLTKKNTDINIRLNSVYITVWEKKVMLHNIKKDLHSRKKQATFLRFLVSYIYIESFDKCTANESFFAWIMSNFHALSIQLSFASDF